MQNRHVRKNTIALIEHAESGALQWETLARECLEYMSEDDVTKMAISADFIDDPRRFGRKGRGINQLFAANRNTGTQEPCTYENQSKI